MFKLLVSVGSVYNKECKAGEQFSGCVCETTQTSNSNTR